MIGAERLVQNMVHIYGEHMRSVAKTENAMRETDWRRQQAEVQFNLTTKNSTK
jgi:hypothetical protein